MSDATKESEAKPKSDHAEILRVAHERFKQGEEAWTDPREKGLDDLKFATGEQWPSDVRSAREADGRPCLTVNRMPQFVRNITNDQRQNRPAIKVSPADDLADVDTAKTLQGIIRHIEYNSNAEVAYDTAFEGAVYKGFGFWRLVTDYVSPTAFEQEILFKAIRNDFSVTIDPFSREPDGSDMNWAFIHFDIPKDLFKAEHPNAEIPKDGERVTEDVMPDWYGSDTVRVAEYYWKEWVDDVLYELSDGTTVLDSEAPEALPEGVSIVSDRPTRVPKIRWAKMTGTEVLDETVIPGRYIPIFPTYGDIHEIDGERVLEGVVRQAKDSQRMSNYLKSTEAEAIALAPRTPFIVAEGQITKEYAQMWGTANQKNHAFLVYKPTSLNGVPVGPPQRNTFEPAIQAISQASLMAAEDLKATTGIYDAALGNRSNEQSGIAIQRRNAQAQTSNFHFVDNLTRSMRHCGRVLVDMIPKVYDTARAIKIMGEEQDEKIVRINEVFDDNGKPKIFDLSIGKYDVVVETGPNYATKRQEAVSSMLEVMRAYPQLPAIAADLMIKNMDWPGATEIAERARKTIPPHILGDDKNKDIPPEVQAQMAQMQQTIQMLAQQNQQMQAQQATKIMELQSKERIAFSEQELKLIIENAKLGNKEALAMFSAEQAERQAAQVRAGQTQNQFQNGAGPSGAAMPNQNQNPTGGQMPGTPIGV